MREILEQMTIGLRAVARAMRHPKHQALALLVVLYGFAGTAFFSWQEGWGFVDSFYFTAVTLSTVGFGDLAPTTTLARVATPFFLIFGLGILGAIVHALVSSVIGSFAERQRSGAT
jgi:voltage-gated potassium channel